MVWRLFYDHHSTQYMQDEPTEEDVKAAVETLDSNACTLISLASERGELLVGGGENDLTIVVYMPDDDARPAMTLLSDPTRSQTDEMELVVGGQMSGPFPMWMLVSRAVALEAMLSLYRTGQIVLSDLWMNDW